MLVRVEEVLDPMVGYFLGVVKVEATVVVMVVGGQGHRVDVESILGWGRFLDRARGVEVEWLLAIGVVDTVCV